MIFSSAFPMFWSMDAAMTFSKRRPRFAPLTSLVTGSTRPNTRFTTAYAIARSLEASVATLTVLPLESVFSSTSTVSSPEFLTTVQDPSSKNTFEARIGFSRVFARLTTLFGEFSP